MSRLERMKRQKITPALPPVMLPHVITRLIEVGLTGSTGMGAVPLAWSEIVGWQQATGVVLTPWETRMIRALSTTYLAELRLAEQETCPPPWRTAATPHERNVETTELLALLRG